MGRCRSYHAGFSEADDQALSTENALWFDAIPPFNGDMSIPQCCLKRSLTQTGQGTSDTSATGGRCQAHQCT